MSGNFIAYLVGYIIAIMGVGYGLHAAGVPTEWIIAAVLILIGLGIVYALSRAERDKATHTRPGASPHTPPGSQSSSGTHTGSPPADRGNAQGESRTYR